MFYGRTLLWTPNTDDPPSRCCEKRSQSSRGSMTGSTVISRHPPTPNETIERTADCRISLVLHMQAGKPNRGV